MTNEVLKMMPDRFHRSLHKLMTVCWRMRAIPSRWKSSDTVLLYKKGDPTKVSNYRPIGLMCTVYKLYTSIVTEVLTDYAEARGMLHLGQ